MGDGFWLGLDFRYGGRFGRFLFHLTFDGCWSLRRFGFGLHFSPGGFSPLDDGLSYIEQGLLFLLNSQYLPAKLIFGQLDQSLFTGFCFPLDVNTPAGELGRQTGVLPLLPDG